MKFMNTQKRVLVKNQREKNSLKSTKKQFHRQRTSDAEIQLSSSTQETSFLQDHGESEEELDDRGKEDSGEHTIEAYGQNMVAVGDDDLDSTEENPVNQETP